MSTLGGTFLPDERRFLSPPPLPPSLSLPLSLCLPHTLIRVHTCSPVRARARARGSSTSIIITFGKYVFVVTPEVSHPRKGKRGQKAPPSSAWGWLLRGWDTRGRFFASRFSAFARRGGAGEKEGDTKVAREVQPGYVSHARTTVDLARE